MEDRRDPMRKGGTAVRSALDKVESLKPRAVIVVNLNPAQKGDSVNQTYAGHRRD
jgi:hypothetical protein